MRRAQRVENSGADGTSVNLTGINNGDPSSHPAEMNRDVTHGDIFTREDKLTEE